ncbi:adaptin N terminal region-domain-containing protein [Ochromonadaceae sp. CCMP2298]|nr:adaptin N terminal region-domain-containing protein [Ochromonadaceae sp. CCMP2298]
MSIKLRDLIRAVRACKTAAEERAVISKECALIRTAIKEEDEQFRHRNVAKLLFIHMLGYPTHFGQLECLKLISSAGFPEKRIGYLGLTLLLTEQTEVLMLVTNSLKVDLGNSNQYIQALSLIAIGNLATQDMARDLASDVEKLLRSNNSYLRKKAALATIRLLKKEPDLIDHMADRITSLLKDRAHGVLITGIQLMVEVLVLLPEWKTDFLKVVPALVRLLRNFLSMGFSPEYDVAGIADPFMQVKILHLLKLLGKGSEEASDQMNDVLAQVATNTETTKNAGNAILYECVQTIMEVESDASLRVLAVNILGRFLLNRDNNIRYVALNSLSKVVSEDMSAVQRHRNTIVDCLKDPDISIRQRALELVFQLVNDQNVAVLTGELLNYLVVAHADHKASLVSKIMVILEKYSGDKRWRIDTVITMLSIAGNETDDSVARTAIIFIAQSEGLQAYAAHRLMRVLLDDSSQLGLVQVSIWCIGEYGSLLLEDCAAPDGSSNTYPAVAEAQVVELLDRALRLHNADNPTKAIVLNALIKLSVRLSPSTRLHISQLIKPFQTSMSLELQQRSTEYVTLLSENMDGLRGQLLDRMPVLDEAAIRRRRAAFDDNTFGDVDSPVKPPAAPSGGTSLLDLDDIFGGGAHAPMANTPVHMAAPTSNLDLLSDIFNTPAQGGTQLLQPQTMSMPMPMPVPFEMPMAPMQMQMPSQMPMPVMQMSQAHMPMQAPAPTSPTPPMIISSPQAAAQAASPTFKAFDEAGLQVFMTVSKPDPSDLTQSRILCTFNNNSDAPMDSLVFQAAVPKYLKLELQPPSSTTIPAQSQGAVTQDIKVSNTMQGQKNLMLKLKIAYKQGGATVDKLTQVSNFPPLF